MEDCIVLDEMLDAFPGDRRAAFAEYSRKRNPDAEAIVDLAMYNYVEVMGQTTHYCAIVDFAVAALAKLSGGCRYNFQCGCLGFRPFGLSAFT